MEHKTTKEKMAGMTTRQKISYIWYYYKYPILAVLFALILATYLISDAATTKKPYVNITLIGTQINTKKLDALSNEATGAIIKDKKSNKDVQMSILLKSADPSDSNNIVAAEKITATISAGDLDILILDKNDFEKYANQNAFVNLDSLKGFKDPDTKNYPLVRYKPEGSSTEAAYGISVDNSSLLKNTEFDAEGKILCVITSSQRKDNVTNFLNWFFSQK